LSQGYIVGVEGMMDDDDVGWHIPPNEKHAKPMVLTPVYIFLRGNS